MTLYPTLYNPHTGFIFLLCPHYAWTEVKQKSINQSFIFKIKIKIQAKTILYFILACLEKNGQRQRHSVMLQFCFLMKKNFVCWTWDRNNKCIGLKYTSNYTCLCMCMLVQLFGPITLNWMFIVQWPYLIMSDSKPLTFHLYNYNHITIYLKCH